MAFVNVKLHVVCGTKNRYPFITKEVKSLLYDHILANAKQKSIFIDAINGAEDHIHLLLCLNADLSISKTIQLIKGESSFWLNKQGILKQKFEWADEYYAVSVSQSMVSKVREYINNQEEHHRKKSFAEECNEFVRKYSFNLHHG